MFASENGLKGDPRLKAISDAITVVPNFPKPGIMFQDITTLISNHKVFKHTVEIFIDRYRDMDISIVAGVEARGFMFAPSIALGIGAKFIPLRKPGKLPGEVISEAYELEYGKDCLEMHVGAVESGERAIIVDDLVATGGTLSAAIRLLERNGAKVVECACVIGLPELKGMCITRTTIAEWQAAIRLGGTESIEIQFLMRAARIKKRCSEHTSRAVSRVILEGNNGHRGCSATAFLSIVLQPDLLSDSG